MVVSLSLQNSLYYEHPINTVAYTVDLTGTVVEGTDRLLTQGAATTGLKTSIHTYPRGEQTNLAQLKKYFHPNYS